MTEVWPRLLHRWFLFLGFLTFFLGTGFLTSGAFHDLSAWSSVWSSRARAQYLETRLPIRNAIPLVNAMNIRKRPVAFLSDPLSAGLDADALYVSWYNVGMLTPYFAAKTEAELAKVLVDKGVELVVVDKGWNASGKLSVEQLALVPLVSDLVWQQGSVSVRKIKASYLHPTEYLRNPTFESTADWNLPGQDMYDSATQSVRVSVASSATQSVGVIAGHDYVNTVRARCLQEATQGRIQVNWHDVRGIFIQTRIEVFVCTPDWSDHTMTVIAPPGAVQAMVFATGHTPIPLAFKSVSFK